MLKLSTLEAEVEKAETLEVESEGGIQINRETIVIQREESDEETRGRTLFKEGWIAKQGKRTIQQRTVFRGI